MNLKELTSEKHKLAETCIFNKRMMSGNITVDEYVTYLYQLREIFKKLEENPLPHSSLNRLDRITDDIIELSSNNVYEILKSTSEYVSYIDKLSIDERLPHIYLNYMALLFGGQMMKRGLPGSGRLYDFDDNREAIVSIRNIQDDSWADEVNRGFDYTIEMFNELQQLFEQHSD
jgi:heme oxygenase